MRNPVDVLIPTFNRPAALAVTLTSLVYQSFQEFRVIISDQSDRMDIADSGEIKAVTNVLKLHGVEVKIHKHLPRRGMAEQRQFLLDLCQAPFALYLDDDVIFEPFVISNLLKLIQKEDCGFVGAAVLYNADRLRETGGFKFWENLPPVHCGEDAMAQLRLLARYGGCGMIPSGVYHQELPTTITDRKIDIPRILPVNYPSRSLVP